METKSESPINIDVLLKQLEEGTSYIETARQKEVVLVLGKTGAGKSTTVNYLLGTKMEEKELDDGTFIVEPASGEKTYAIIGHTATSCTLYPTVYAKPGSALGFGDCPGFGDSRGREEQITVSVSIELAVKKAQCIKAIMVVVSREELMAGRGEVFKNISSMLGKLIQSPQSIKDSILFVITKPEERTNHKGILSTVEKISKTAKDQIKILGERYKGSKDKPKEIQDEEDKLSILSLITEKNLFVIDVLEKTKTLDRRDKLLDFINKANAIPVQQFRFNAYDEGRSHLNLLISDVVNHGNALFERVNQLPIEINNVQKEINNTKKTNDTYTTQINQIKSGKELSEAEKEKTKKAYNESIKANDMQIKDYQAQIKVKEKEKENKENEMNIYNSNELVTYQSRSAYVEGYLSASFFKGFTLFIANFPGKREVKYKGLAFEQVEKTMIHDYMPGYTPTWIDETENKAKGEYTATFRHDVAYGSASGYVHIKLKKKNIPENANRIKTLASDIEVLKESIKQLEKSSIPDLERKNKGIQEDILNLETQNVMDKCKKENLMKDLDKKIELNKIECSKKEKEIILKIEKLQATEKNIKTEMSKFEMVERMSILQLAVPGINEFFKHLNQYRQPQLTVGNKATTITVSNNPSSFFQPPPVNTRNEKVETRSVEQKSVLPQ